MSKVRHFLSFDFELSGKFAETLMNIFAELWAHFHILQSILFGQDIALLKSHLPLRLQIAFSPYEYFADIFIRIGFYLLDPGSYVVIGFVVGDRIC